MRLFRLCDSAASRCFRAPAFAQAFPGAAGWAAQTPGGRGGAIIRVTNLNASGPGSFRAAIEARGPANRRVRGRRRDRHGPDHARPSTEPFLTIAGQTAPSPGITLIRGGIDIRTHDVIIRHIRIRTGVSGQARRSGWEADAISTVGAWNVIVDHCTMTWALDENLSASGPRFTGTTVADWRRGASHDITFSYNLLAEGLAHGSHPKGEHSKGSLIHDNATGILIYRNIYAHNYERSPLLKGGVHAAVVNNLIFDPGAQAIHYNLMDLEWGDHPHQLGELSRGRQRAARRLLDPRPTSPSSPSAASATCAITAATISPSTARAGRCRCSAATRPARRGSSRSPRPVDLAGRACPSCPPTRSRPMSCAMPAPAPGTATRTTSA